MCAGRRMKETTIGMLQKIMTCYFVINFVVLLFICLILLYHRLLFMQPIIKIILLPVCQARTAGNQGLQTPSAGALLYLFRLLGSQAHSAGTPS